MRAASASEPTSRNRSVMSAILERLPDGFAARDALAQRDAVAEAPRHGEGAGSHGLEGSEIRVQSRERAVMTERHLRDRLGPPHHPRAERRNEARATKGTIA